MTATTTCPENNSVHFWIPEIPSTPVDLINRRAAATGSPRYAMATAGADYNGHSVSVSFKRHAVSGPTWNCEYWWAGRVVIARGSLESCARAAANYMAGGAHGAVVHAETDCAAPESLHDQVATLLAHGFVLCPAAVNLNGVNSKQRPAWWTPRHEAVMDAMNWERLYPAIMSWALQYDGTVEEWPVARDAWMEAAKAERRLAVAR